ncbi:hypothetical protein [Streptomyces azureus]|uniref:Membrane protein n=1 Tax=Streptomyces azureus TaxID=146537 RepID=A0A0K8PCM3_STRAJ|nr:hypothetical protein [Streptomyces azureus]GAP45647.1 membrane protein [Streptomyces azureus]
MTTCSSPPRSNEPAIPDEPNGSAQPSAETTVATGTYQVEQTGTQPAAGSHETYGSSDRPGTQMPHVREEALRAAATGRSAGS